MQHDRIAYHLHNLADLIQRAGDSNDEWARNRLANEVWPACKQEVEAFIRDLSRVEDTTPAPF